MILYVLPFSYFIMQASQPAQAPILVPVQTRVTLLNNNQHTFNQTVSHSGYQVQMDTQHVAPSARAGSTNARTELKQISQHNSATYQARDGQSSGGISITNHNHHNVIQSVDELKTILDPEVPIDELRPGDSEWAGPSFFTRLGGNMYWYWNYFGSTKYVVGGLALGYSAVLIKLLYDSYAINNNESWATWRSDIPLEALAKIQKEVTQALVVEIQKTYIQQPTADYVLTPNVQFMLDVEDEIAGLQNFLKLNEWIEYLRIARLFPNQEETKNVALLKIKRLEFLLKLMINHVGASGQTAAAV